MVVVTDGGFTTTLTTTRRQMTFVIDVGRRLTQDALEGSAPVSLARSKAEAKMKQVLQATPKRLVSLNRTPDPTRPLSPLTPLRGGDVASTKQTQEP